MNLPVLPLPVYTPVDKKPKPIFKLLPTTVFSTPFFNTAASKIYPNDTGAIISDELLQLKGFIFHTSHCGSTLLSNMISTSSTCRVVSETEAINGLFLSSIFYDISRNEVVQKLKDIISAYQIKESNSSECFLLFKLTSWNIFFIDIFQEAYPTIPWIYLNRELGIVRQKLLKSNGGMESWWEHPVPILVNYFTGTTPASKEEYLTLLIKNHQEKAIQAHNKYALFYDYPFDKKINSILNHFNLSFSKREVEQTKEALLYDAKTLRPYQK